MLACFWAISIVPICYGETDLSEELIAQTESEARAVARVLHEYHLKEIEIERKGIDLKDGTMLGGKYSYDLNQISARFENAFAQLVRRVESETGDREDSKRLAGLLAYHWRREMYGFGDPEELEEQLSTRRSLAWIAAAFCALLVGSISKRTGKQGESVSPLKLPPELERVSVPGVRYRVHLLTGLVLDKEMWDEVRTTTTYHGGFFGGNVGESITESIRKGKTFVLTHEGKEDLLNLTGHGHDYRPGNIVTFVFYGRGKKRNAVVTYNHATGKFEENIGLDEVHGTMWKTNFAFTGIAAYLAFDWASAPMQDLGVENGFGLVALSAGIALAFATVLHVYKKWRRNRKFRKSYLSRLEVFFREGDMQTREAFQKFTNISP